MKNILATFILSLTAVFVIGQTTQVTITGQVTDSVGTPVPGYQVIIIGDSTPTFPGYYNMVFTNPNGYYQDVVTIPANMVIPFIILVSDCNGMILSQTGMSSSQTITANFSICTGSPPPGCQGFFTWAPGPPGTTNTILFHGATNATAPATYTWSFGDGSGGTGQNVQHTYASAGTYTVTMTVVAGNCTAVDSQLVFVGTNPPGCTAFWGASPQPGNPGVISFFDLSTGNPSSYLWDFGDGTSSTMQNPTHTYSQNGLYLVCLTISDSASNCYDTYCDSLMIGTPPPPCHNQFTYQVNGLAVTFNGSLVNGGSASYAWNFGDGNTGTGQTVTHTYASQGVYFVSLITVDTNGCQSVSHKQVTVGNVPNCQAHFTWVPDSANYGIQFIDLSVGSPQSWYWDFGDGTSSTAQNPQHSYSGPGTYYVCLTITDSGSCTSTFCDSVFVVNSNCYGNFTLSMSPANNLVVTFHGTSSMPQAIYTWDFGDGTSGTGQNVTHTYLQGGLYNVCMTISGGGMTCPPICRPVHVGGANPGVGAFAGHVITGNSSADYATVYLIEYDSVANTLTAVDTVQIDSMGFFFFQNIPFGKYLVKAALNSNSAVYSNYMPTYYGDVLYWSNASFMHVNQVMITWVIPIHMVSGNNPGGPGFIGGNISQGANKLLDVGDPVAGVEVLILDMNNNPVTYTFSDQSGKFSITGLAYGTYKVYAEVAGLPCTPAIVTLSAQQPGQNVSIEINTTSITTGIGQLSEAVDIIGLVYPNPASELVRLEIGLSGNTSLSFEVLDQYGRTIRQFNREPGSGMHVMELDMSGVSSGIYLLNVRSDDGASSTQRITLIR